MNTTEALTEAFTAALEAGKSKVVFQNTEGLAKKAFAQAAYKAGSAVGVGVRINFFTSYASIMIEAK